MSKRITIIFFLFSTVLFCQSKTTLEFVNEANNFDFNILELNQFIKERLIDKEQIAEFFYHWISLNIKYDHETLNLNKKGKISDEEYYKKQNPKVVFKERKGVCSGYSNLFKLFMDDFGIPCEKIIGIVRLPENITVELESDEEFLHAWNAIKLNNDWKLLDVTWAKQFNDFPEDNNFKISPSNFILSHYPFDEKWQLLDNPIVLEEYNKLPYVHSFYFQVGFKKLPIFKNDDDYIYIEFVDNPNKNWLIKLDYSLDNIKFDSVHAEYIQGNNSNIYKFKKTLLPKNSYLRVSLGNFNQEKQTIQNYENVILYRF